MGNGLCKSAKEGDLGNKSITSRDKAILDLKVQRDRLKQYQKKVP